MINSQNGNQVSFQHINFAIVNPGTDKYVAANNGTNPCSKESCDNGSLCVISSNTTYQCLCTAGWRGEEIIFVSIIIIHFN